MSKNSQKPILAWRQFDAQSEEKSEKNAAQKSQALKEAADREEKRLEKIEAELKQNRKDTQSKIAAVTNEILQGKRDTNNTHFALVATPVAAATGVNFMLYQSPEPIFAVAQFATVVGLTAYTIGINIKYFPRGAEYKKMLDIIDSYQVSFDGKKINLPSEIPSFRKLRSEAREEIKKSGKKAFNKYAANWAVGIISGIAIASSVYQYNENFKDIKRNDEEITIEPSKPTTLVLTPE